MLRAYGLGFRAYGLGFRAYGLGFRGLGFRVSCSRFSLRSRVSTQVSTTEGMWPAAPELKVLFHNRNRRRKTRSREFKGSRKLRFKSNVETKRAKAYNTRVYWPGQISIAHCARINISVFVCARTVCYAYRS